MSRKISNEEYNNTFSGKFKAWLNGEKDFYLGNVEMVSQPIQDLESGLPTKEQKQARRQEYLNKTVFDNMNNRYLKAYQKFYSFIAVLFCIFLATVLIFSVLGLPEIGNPNNPVNNEVSERYIEKGMQETGAVNIVTGMILDYRAFDTLGESHVLFLATCAVLILLRLDKNRHKQAYGTLDVYDREYEPKNDIILKSVSKFLVPVIIVFGIYIILCGHLGPGGGFSGGAVIGGGLILYASAFGSQQTEKFFNRKVYTALSVSALGCYSLCKSYSFYTGANEIESIIPMGITGNILSSGLILILNICVGLVVAGTMYTFFTMFRKGDF